MSLKLYNENDIKIIADSVRGKGDTSSFYTVHELDEAILNLNPMREF